MQEQTPVSRAEINPSVGQEQHVAADEVIINGGVNAEIYIFKPRLVKINQGVNNRYIIYTDDKDAVRLVQNNVVNCTVIFESTSNYSAKSGGSSPSPLRDVGNSPKVVGARQVHVGGRVGGSIITDSNTHNFNFPGNPLVTGGWRTPDISSLGRPEQTTGPDFREHFVDESEASQLGIESGTYYLGSDLYTSPRIIGNNTYTITTSTINRTGVTIGLGGGRMGYAVRKGNMYLYQKS